MCVVKNSLHILTGWLLTLSSPDHLDFSCISTGVILRMPSPIISAGGLTQTYEPLPENFSGSVLAMSECLS